MQLLRKSIILFIASVLLITISTLPSTDTAEAYTADNNKVRWEPVPSPCFQGTCKCPKKKYSTNKKFSRSAIKGTKYRYLGRYVDGGNSASVSINWGYNISVTTTMGVSAEYANASVGIGVSRHKNYTYTDTVNNKSKKRKYVHAGAEFETRTGKVKRWDRIEIKGGSTQQKHKYKYKGKSTVKAKVISSKGYSLLKKKYKQF